MSLPPDSSIATVLADRSHELLTIDAELAPAQAAVLRHAIGRMLQAPTAQELAQQFFDEGGSAHLVIVDEATMKADPTLHDAAADWIGGSAQIRLREAYLLGGQESIDQKLPAILAHEILGHSLWYARAEREDVIEGMHYHKFNELHARLVGWLVDLELDGHFAAGAEGIRSFLDDPHSLWDRLQVLTPYYAMIFSSAEMRDPVAALAERAKAARNRRIELERELFNQQTWLPVIDHFVELHGVDASRTRKLQDEFANSKAEMERVIARVDAVIAKVDQCLDRFHCEADHTTERYLAQVAEHPLIARLGRATEELAGRLRQKIIECPRDPFETRPELYDEGGEPWHDQIDFDALKAMYLLCREQFPGHWR
jgi:hypothetical protein